MINVRQSLLNTQTQRANQPIPGQAANLRQALAAKSGKAGATTGPAISNIQEQAALEDFSALATQQQKAGQLDVAAQQQQQQAQEQQFAQQQQRIQIDQSQAISAFNQSVDRIDNQLERLGKYLDSKRGQDALEQALFVRRLADDKYVFKLNQDGQIRRLEDANAFAIEAGKAAFANQLELFDNQVRFDEMMQMGYAEFRKELAKMDIATATQIINTEIASANKTAMYSAAADFVGTGVKMAATEYTDAKSGDKTTLLQNWMKDSGKEEDG